MSPRLVYYSCWFKTHRALRDFIGTTLVPSWDTVDRKLYGLYAYQVKRVPIPESGDADLPKIGFELLLTLEEGSPLEGVVCNWSRHERARSDNPFGWFECGPLGGERVHRVEDFKSNEQGSRNILIDFSK